MILLFISINWSMHTLPDSAFFNVSRKNSIYLTETKLIDFMLGEINPLE